MEDFDLKEHIDRSDHTISELSGQFREMGQTKTTFDSFKFTVGKEGNFIASQFQFLMRQYRYAVLESRRLLLDYDERSRDTKYLQKEIRRRETGVDYDADEIIKEKMKDTKYPDLEISRKKNEMINMEIDICGKMKEIEDFEVLRKRLIEMNGGKEFTNKQFQEEQPRYYQWFIARKIEAQVRSKQLGITEGILEAHDMAAREPIIENSNMKIEPMFDIKGLPIPQKIREDAMLECDNHFVNVRQIESDREQKKLKDISRGDKIKQLCSDLGINDVEFVNIKDVCCSAKQ